MTDIKINLTREFVSWINEEDASLVLPHKWHVIIRRNLSMYAATNIKVDGKYRYTKMHRLILAPPAHLVVDHRDGDGLNNRRSNLRVCTQSDNMRNRRSYGKSQYLGVAFDKTAGRNRPWAATLGRVRIGRFASEIEAAIAYDKAALAEYGEFARPNFLAAARKVMD